MPVSELYDEWDYFFVGLAHYVSSKSKDPSTKVGSVIVRPDNTVAGLGYNGFPRKMPDMAESYQNREEKYSRIIHAEINALIHTRESVKGCTLYTYPLLPCDRCAVQMIQAGIAKFVAPEVSPALQDRWGPILNKTKQYAYETGVRVIEIPHHHILSAIYPK